MASSKKIRRRIPLFLAAFWTVAISWQLYSMQARGLDHGVMESDAAVRVEVTDETIGFTPVVDTASVGLIFYPGALVDPDAYAPLARDVAAAGYRAVIVKVPFRIDMFGWQQQAAAARTASVLAGDSGDRAWVIGGHSRGGRMAMEAARDAPDRFAGLLLVGTSHPRRDDLSRLGIDVTKVYGTNDGLASVEEVEAFAGNLPPHTRFVRVEGGNHRQFGYYGRQLGDAAAAIDRETQRRATAEAIVAQLRRIGAR